MAEKSIEQYLSVLNKEQREAVEHEGSPLLILAGAGSGKTRVITTKIAYLISCKDVNPYSILSVTFTKKAANEMRERAINMEALAEKSQIRTFHSFGSWFLRKYSKEAGISSSFTVYDENDMAVILKRAVPALDTNEVKIAIKQIALAKDYCLGPNDNLSVIASEFDLPDIYKKYEERLRATGNVDFGDLIMLPVNLLEASPEIATEIHSRFNVFLVDEYQDSNIAQYKFLQKISGIEEGYNNYVCVVGDDDQSIYKFRGAEVQNILNFSKNYPGTEIIRLERNYRSTSEILAAASLVVSKNTNRLGKTLVSDKGSGGMPVIAYLLDQTKEIMFVEELIEKSVKQGGKYSDWAIMYRTNAQSRAFEKDFVIKKIPYVLVGSLRFYEREEIKDALAYLALCVNPKDEVSFSRIINKPTRGIGEKTQEKILDSCRIEYGDGGYTYKNIIETLDSMKDNLSNKAGEGAKSFIQLYNTLLNSFDESKKLSSLIEKLITLSGLDKYHKAKDPVDGEVRRENLFELINEGVDLSCTKESLLAFLDRINVDRSNELKYGTDSNDVVTLITLHNTKGLEYNKVVITGVEQGLFPSETKSGADLEEERRLFYVGITRAKDELYITSTGSRLIRGQWKFMSPSIFLEESEEAFKVVGQKPRPQYQYGWAGYGAGGMHTRPSAEGEPASKWKPGTKLYHDDYGYGVVVSNRMNGNEFMIEVQFETGAVKKFLPEYQSKALQIIK